MAKLSVGSTNHNSIVNAFKYQSQGMGWRISQAWFAHPTYGVSEASDVQKGKKKRNFMIHSYYNNDGVYATKTVQ